MNFKRKLLGPVALGALAAAYRPNANRKPRKETQILALSLSILMNESITREQKNLEGTETEKCERVLPGHKSEGKQEVYVVSERMVKIILSMQNRNDCELFREYIDSGHIVPYFTAKQIEKRKLKRMVACGKKKR